ncbi:basic amino acid/polyamine antiporter, APA family [Nonomuraea solani]|uniref:Basic amino acid/polyamine antiporter, APA family n=1 Tax=Nonomuraea solani TaxID=1144553 RepID=A0A1H5ZGN1_9ACTN|nr:amino acid permease [Nonomuraea solani]SEG35673.1 basic amino acid/polyamine antiporter, APA family [Nonomuraea solani]
MDIFRTKSVEQSIRDTEAPEHQLRKRLTATDLTVFGIGVIVGTGIFVLTGQVAKEMAGPAVAVSFIVAGIVCGLAALCYAEFASTIPVAGSAYTFSFATLGEFPAWVIGWDLMLELALAAAVVAVGWSGYFASMLASIGLELPAAIAGEDPVVNVPAVLIVLILTSILVAGIKLSSRVNLILVITKIAVVLLVIVAGLFFIKTANYTPFVPDPVATPRVEGLRAPLMQVVFGITPVAFGVLGVFSAAAIVFFAFIGFDIVATAAEETINPQRDVPRGIIGSLAICTALYVAVSLVVVGMQRYSELSTTAPLSDAFISVGQSWLAAIISVGAIAGLTTVVLVLLMGQTRVLFAMCRDGLLPRSLGKVHPTFGTPARLTILIGVVTMALAGFVSFGELAELVNIGTLFAFVVVSIGVVILRRTRPDLPRAFKAPLVPVLPIVSVLACLYLMFNLPVQTWLRFVAWMLIGVVIYLSYGYWNSRNAAPWQKARR